jgi:hypothetical protein
MKKGWTLWVWLGIFLFGISIHGAMAAEGGKYTTIVLKEFSLEGAAIQELPEVKDYAQTLPPEFSTMVKDFLETMKVSQNVVEEKAGKEGATSANAVIVEGRFTKISAGSTAARWVVGWGAGASSVGAEWTVKDASTGKELGKYNRNQHTSSAYRGIQAVESDARYLAKYVASTIQKLVK